jgi:hypothetical protein
MEGDGEKNKLPCVNSQKGEEKTKGGISFLL